MTITQHVRNIETLTESQNQRLLRGVSEEIGAGREDTRAKEPAARPKRKRKAWKRGAYGTRSAQYGGAEAQNGAGAQAGSEIVNAAFEPDPTSYGQAMKRKKSEGWQKAMGEEIMALEANQVWNLVKRSVGINALHSKWVYKTKTDAEDQVERLKARLVACGN